jgi:phage protein D
MIGLSSLPTPAGPSPTTDTLTLRVSIGGQDLDAEVMACLSELTVTQNLGQPATLSMRLTAWDAQTDQLRWVDDDTFEPGSSVEVALGYANNTTPLFWGEIVELELAASASARAALTVTAKDMLYRFERGEKARGFEDVTYGDVVATVASDYNISTDTEPDLEADPQNAYVYQDNKSDFDFLTELAQAIHYEFFISAEDKSFVFQKSQLGSDPQLSLAASTDLVDVTISLQAPSQLGGVDVRTLDSDAKKKVVVSVDNPDTFDDDNSTTRQVLKDPPAFSKEDVEAYANAALLQMRLKYLRVTGTCFGRTDLVPGIMIELRELGTRFGGAYYVTGATHTVSEGGYRTHFTLEGEPR